MTVGNNGWMWTCEQCKKSDSLRNVRRDWLFCWRRLFKQTVCRHNPNHFTREPEAMQVQRSALTFPAPTGPMTVRSWCDFTVTEMFCRDGASKLFDKRKTPERFRIFTILCTTEIISLQGHNIHLIPVAGQLLHLNAVFPLFLQRQLQVSTLHV